MRRLKREVLRQASGSAKRVSSRRRAAVIGGGIAGVAASAVLAERGVEVTLLEREEHLGGRAGGWEDTLKGGENFQMERGFHAFFRQYYNLRSLLRRIDPDLEFLAPMEDYPILGANGHVESFSHLPHRPPFNVIELTRRTPHLGWRDLLRVNARAALAMLRYDDRMTYRRYDERSAREYLDSLRFPPTARSMLFNVFAHSFFNPEEKMSSGELLMMFHFYFMGNPEGLIFDVVRRPMKSAIWTPFAEYLRSLGADLHFGESATSVRRRRQGWLVETTRTQHEVDEVVLALTVPALQRLVASSPDLRADPDWLRQVDSLETTHPFAVLRLWYDRPAAPGRSPFAGTTGVGILDNISIYDRFQDESERWARRVGGSVVELHAYGIRIDFDEDQVRRQLLADLAGFYPEYANARILEERLLIRRDCPAFAPGTHRLRPGVTTPFPGLTLAGDFVRLPIPSALMERAATSGYLAANHLLSREGVVPQPVESVPRRGLLAAPHLLSASRSVAPQRLS